ncbi:MAG: class I SAM-dependent methyltransferase [Pseudohongiellaceae bacterium]
MTHSNTSAAKLLVANLPLLEALRIDTGVLDLACGSGRNGGLLVRRGLPVTFADRDAESLRQVAATAGQERQDGQNGQFGEVRLWQVDLEAPGSEPLRDKCFDAVLVFNYLHRPLLPALCEVVRPGGLLFYETFTTAQRAYGRPRNPDFLLRPGELRETFADWDILHDFEGELPDPTRAVASLIARKPET